MQVEVRGRSASHAVHRALHAGGEDRARAAARRSFQPGLAALDRRVRERRDALFADLSKDWLGEGRRTARLRVQVANVIGGLDRRRAGRTRTRT